MDISLTKLPWYAQIGAFVLLAGAGVGIFFYYYEMPARADMDVRQNQLKAIRVDISKGLATAGQLDKFRADVDGLETNSKASAPCCRKRRTPPTSSAACSSSRRSRTSPSGASRPAPTVTKQLHAEWPIKLEIDGTYHNLATFFDRVGKFTRIVNITRPRGQRQGQAGRQFDDHGDVRGDDVRAAR